MSAVAVAVAVVVEQDDGAPGLCIMWVRWSTSSEAGGLHRRRE